MSTINDARDVLQSWQWFGVNTTATYCTFRLREKISVLTYTRCAATSGTCRIRGGFPPPPPRHTSHRPGAHAATERCQVESAGGGPRRGNYSGRLPFPDPRDANSPACELRDARPPVLKLVDRLRAAQLKMRAGRRCHPLKTVRAGNFNEPCCSFLPARGAVLIVPRGSRQ